MPASREDDALRNTMTLFTQFISPWGAGGGGGGVTIFLVSLPYRCSIPNLVKIGPVFLEKTIFREDARRTTTDANPKHYRSPDLLRKIENKKYHYFLNRTKKVCSSHSCLLYTCIHTLKANHNPQN